MRNSNDNAFPREGQNRGSKNRNFSNQQKMSQKKLILTREKWGGNKKCHKTTPFGAFPKFGGSIFWISPRHPKEESNSGGPVFGFFGLKIGRGALFGENLISGGHELRDYSAVCFSFLRRIPRIGPNWGGGLNGGRRLC